MDPGRRHCPQCQSRLVRLAPPQGAGERLLGLATLYALRCQACGHRWIVFWGRFDFIPHRDFVRVPVGYPIWFHPLTGQGPEKARRGTMVNLSLGGCRILSRTIPPERTHLRLEFEISDNEAPIAVEEAVVCAHPRGGMGLAFLRVQAAEQRRISRIVRDRLSATLLGLQRARSG